MKQHWHVGPWQIDVPEPKNRTIELAWGSWHFHWGKLAGGGRWLQTPWFGMAVAW